MTTTKTAPKRAKKYGYIWIPDHSQGLRDAAKEAIEANRELLFEDETTPAGLVRLFLKHPGTCIRAISEARKESFV